MSQIDGAMLIRRPEITRVGPGAHPHTSHVEQIRKRLGEHLTEVVEQQTAGRPEKETA